MHFSLDEILKDLNKISGLRISVFDLDQNLISGYPPGPSPFCNFVRRSVPANEFTCLKQDRLAFEFVKKTRAPYIYQCYMGLLEAIAPLYYHGIPAGYLMIGQVLENVPTGKERVLFAARKLTDNTSYVDSLLSSLPSLTLEQMQSFSHIVSICAEYITLKHDFTVTHKTLAEELLFYLNMHYQEKITMQDLCGRFYSSKTTLNKIFQTYYNTSIFDKLHEIRLEEACVLLKTTETPIHLIAKQCGFEDANYFSRIFRKAFHCSPSQYRKT